ncbi:MAG TPA: hypothetical protein VF926_03815 [Mycobacterium sp.]
MLIYPEPIAGRRHRALGLQQQPGAAQRAQQRGSGAQGGRARQAPRRPADPSTAKDSNTVRQARGEASTIWAASAGVDATPRDSIRTRSTIVQRPRRQRHRVGVSIEATTRLFAPNVGAYVGAWFAGNAAA